MDDKTPCASDNEEEQFDDEDDEGAGVSSKQLDFEKKKKKKKKPLPPIRINLSACKYEVLRIVQRKFGWREVGDEEDWEIYWTDTSVSIERVMKLSKTQKLNHFSGMLELCRKKLMGRNLQKMQRVFPQHYDFFPKTFILPVDMQELVNDIKARGKKQIYILKPDAGCQGRGIRLIQGGKEEVLQETLAEMKSPNIVAQHYLPKPFLVHGYKFDLRIYALVLACDPLRVFVYKEGLARICTEKYTKPKASNLNISYIHLTNYAVNKHNEHFVANQGGQDDAENASKLGLAQLAEYVTQQGHDWGRVWQDIHQLIVKSLISVQPILKNNYRSAVSIDNDGFSCFEVLGYDIMLDEELRPWLIECNHSSSFNVDSPLDLAIKEALITDTLQLVRVDPKLIMRAKRMEKRSAAERLLEPMHRKKAPAGAAVDAGGGSAPAAAAAAAAAGSPARLSAVSAAAAAVAAAARDVDGDVDGGGDVPFRPKTAEDLEAWRAEIVRKREKYEEENLGGYMRIFPSPDPKLQALYEELLKGAADIYGSAFAKKKPIDTLSEAERKKKEESESESVKADRARAKALRDKLAQQAVERRKLKAQFQASQQAMSAAAQAASRGAAAAYASSLYGQSPAYVGMAGSEWGGGYGHAYASVGLVPPPGAPPMPMVMPLTPPGTAASARGDGGTGAYGMGGLYLDGTALGDAASGYHMELYGEDSDERAYAQGGSAALAAGGSSLPGSRPASGRSSASYAQPSAAPSVGSSFPYRPGDTAEPMSLVFGRLLDAHHWSAGTSGGSGRTSLSSRPAAAAAASHALLGASGSTAAAVAAAAAWSAAGAAAPVLNAPLTTNTTNANTTTLTTTTTGASAPAPFRACRPASACSVPASWAAAGAERRAVGPQQAASSGSPELLAHPAAGAHPAGTQPHPGGAAAGPANHQPFDSAPQCFAGAGAVAGGRPTTAPHGHAARDLHAQAAAVAGGATAAGTHHHHHHHQSHYQYQHQHPHHAAYARPGAAAAPAARAGTHGQGRPSSAAPHYHHHHQSPGAAAHTKLHTSPAVTEPFVAFGPAGTPAPGGHTHPHATTAAAAGGWVGGRVPAGAGVGHSSGGCGGAASGAAGGASNSLRNKLQPAGGEPSLLQPGAGVAAAGGGGAAAAPPDVPPPAAAQVSAAAWGAVAGAAAAAGAAPGGGHAAGGQQDAGAAGAAGATGAAGAAGAGAVGTAGTAGAGAAAATSGASLSQPTGAVRMAVPTPTPPSSRWLDHNGSGWDWSTGVYLSGGPLTGHNLAAAQRGAQATRAQSAGAGTAHRGRLTATTAAGRAARASTARPGGGGGVSRSARSFSAAQRPAAPSSNGMQGAVHQPAHLSPATSMFSSQAAKQQQQQVLPAGHQSAPGGGGSLMQFMPYMLDSVDGGSASSATQSGIMTMHRGLSLSRRAAVPGDGRASAVGSAAAAMAGHAIVTRAVYGGTGSPISPSSPVCAGAAVAMSAVPAVAGGGGGGKAVSLSSHSGSGNTLAIAVATSGSMAGTGAPCGTPGAGPVGASLFFSHFAGRPDLNSPASRSASQATVTPPPSSQAGAAAVSSSGSGEATSAAAAAVVTVTAAVAPKPPVMPRPSSSSAISYCIDSPDKRRSHSVATDYSSFVSGAVLTVTGRKLSQQG